MRLAHKLERSGNVAGTELAGTQLVCSMGTSTVWLQHSWRGAGTGLLKSFGDFPWECTIPRPQLQLQDGWNTGIVRLAHEPAHSDNVNGTQL